MLEVQPIAIPDVKILIPKRFSDHRGVFCETYTRQRFVEAGISEEFVRDNHSLSVPWVPCRGCIFRVVPSHRSSSFE